MLPQEKEFEICYISIGGHIVKQVITLLKNMKCTDDFLMFVNNEFEVIEVEDPFNENLEINNRGDLNDEDRLFITLIELSKLKKDYDNLNIAEEIFYDTLTDLTYRINRYYSNNHKYGLSKHDIKWLGYIFRMETFQIGSLKFRKYPLTYLEIERSGDDYLPLSQNDKEIFYEGLNVIYVHIAKGVDLSEESVTRSFKMAKEFFKNHFPAYKYEYFVCRTWMLYPGLKDILSEDSNILKFQNRFKIVASHTGISQSLVRVYGTDDVKEIAYVDKKSSLQKSMINNLDKLGVSFGYIERRDV